jgi:hypothetical protein
LYGQGTCDESFFQKYHKQLANLGRWAKKSCGEFGVFPVELSAHILSLCVENQPLFLHKTKVLRCFKGISIWNMNLGCKELEN